MRRVADPGQLSAWARTIGTLLPSTVPADPRPGIVTALRVVLGLWALLLAVELVVILATFTPGRAVPDGAAVALGLGGTLLAFRGLARGQRWALRYAVAILLVLFAEGIWSVIAPAVPGTITIPVGSILAAALLLRCRSSRGALAGVGRLPGNGLRLGSPTPAMVPGHRRGRPHRADAALCGQPLTRNEMPAQMHAIRYRLAMILLAASVVASCAGAAPSNGLAYVANLSTSEASFHWQSPGLLGTPLLGGSGTEPIPACETYLRGFAPGNQRITVSSASSSRSFDLVAPSSGQRALWLVIRPGGEIEETTAIEAPASPFCVP